MNDTDKLNIYNQYIFDKRYKMAEIFLDENFNDIQKIKLICSAKLSYFERLICRFPEFKLMYIDKLIKNNKRIYQDFIDNKGIVQEADGSYFSRFRNPYSYCSELNIKVRELMYKIKIVKEAFSLILTGEQKRIYNYLIRIIKNNKYCLIQGIS